jgi:hypothetical protein
MKGRNIMRSLFCRFSAVLGCALLLAAPAVMAGSGTKPSRVSGQITAVDTTANQVTFTTKSGSTVTVNVTSTTKIEVRDNEKATLSQLSTVFTSLPTGAKLMGSASYDPTTSNAFRIKAEEENGGGEGD